MIEMKVEGNIKFHSHCNPVNVYVSRYYDKRSADIIYNVISIVVINLERENDLYEHGYDNVIIPNGSKFRVVLNPESKILLTYKNEFGFISNMEYRYGNTCHMFEIEPTVSDEIPGILYGFSGDITKAFDSAFTAKLRYKRAGQNECRVVHSIGSTNRTKVVNVSIKEVTCKDCRELYTNDGISKLRMEIGDRIIIMPMNSKGFVYQSRFTFPDNITFDNMGVNNRRMQYSGVKSCDIQILPQIKINKERGQK